MKKLLALAVVILGFTAISFGQSSVVSAAAKASATIVSPLSIALDAPLNFGNIANTSGGDVKLDPIAAATRTALSSGVMLPTLTGTVSAAKFTITGESGISYTVSAPLKVTLSGPSSSTMDIADFKFGAGSGTLGTLSGTLGTSTTQEIYVGGTLTVKAVQPAGEYTNTTDLKVTVNYN